MRIPVAATPREAAASTRTVKGASAALISCAVVASIAVGLLSTGAGAQTASTLILAIAPLIAILAFRKILNPAYISPIIVTAAIFTLIADIGFYFRNVFAGQAGASIRIFLDDATAHRTLLLISSSTVVLVVSGAISSAIFSRQSRITGSRQVPFSWRAPRPRPELIILLVAPPLYYALTTGYGPFVYRDSYLFGEQGSFTSAVITQLLTLTMVLSGYMLARGTPGLRAWVIPVAVVNILLILSLGSRRFALIPALLALGFFLGINSRLTRFGLALGVLLTLLLLPLPLEFRSSTAHGILPYWQIMLDHDWVHANYLGSMNNIFVGFGIIAQSAFGGGSVSWQDILISLNPATGESAGFYDIAQRLRLNAYTPMAGLGELGNVGASAVVTVMMLFGVALGFFESVVRSQVSKGAFIYVGLVIGAISLFALQMTQYNLRLSSRLITYLFVVEVIRRFFIALRNRNISGSKTVRYTRRPTRISTNVRRG